MPTETPASIRAYFEAVEGGRTDSIAAAFSPDGEVRDERQVHRGREAIMAWAADTLQRYQMSNEILSEHQDAAAHVVVARVTGTFPGSPLDFTYRFTLGSEYIQVLEISL